MFYLDNKEQANKNFPVVSQSDAHVGFAGLLTACLIGHASKVANPQNWPR